MLEGSDTQESCSEFEYEEPSDVDIRSEGKDAPDDEMVIEPPEVRRAPYLIMNHCELIERQSRCIANASELLEVPSEESFVLLREHGWDLSRLQEAWFLDESKVRGDCGLGLTPSSSSMPVSSTHLVPTKCPICLSQVDSVAGLDCGHSFCQTCWQGYLHCQVDDGKACVQARCPQHKCSRIVPAVYFRRFCDETRQKKYEEWFLRTYVDNNPSVKWCTNPAGCLYACEYQGVDMCEIRCTCGFVWCWACGEEAHRPADCKTVNKWNIKNSAESENISWIRANTKKCPKCHKSIEKNQGCNHMICSKAGGCGHEFCWLCLGEWSKHGSSTGGYYQCNIYERQAKEGKHAEEERNQQNAKHTLEKYMFYFERFMQHDRGMKITTREESDVEKRVQTLHDNHGFEIIELQFLYDALKQVRACRRVLKWTYVYGYYLEDAGPEKNLFEHLQRNLEEKTDCLHELLERDFEALFASGSDQVANVADSRDKFMALRSHITNFTNVTRKFLTQILKDIPFGDNLHCRTI